MIYLLVYLLVLCIILPYTLILLSVNRTDEDIDEPKYSSPDESLKKHPFQKQPKNGHSHYMTFLV